MIGWPCFRFRIIGHYFALVTLALSEIVRLIIVGLRELDRRLAGPDARSPRWPTARAMSLTGAAVRQQAGLVLHRARCAGWRRCTSGTGSTAAWSGCALEAISEDEDAAASVGIDVTRTKLKITVLSAAMTSHRRRAVRAVPDVREPGHGLRASAISLQMVFGVIAGGMFVMLGPTVGAVFLLLLSEGLRVLIGNQVLGVVQRKTIYAYPHLLNSYQTSSI